MLILVLDSSGSFCGVCIWQDGEILAQSMEVMQRGQDARLMPMIMDTLEKSGKTFADLDRVAATKGPGSFTGVRVCLAAARGIGLAANKPVFGIDRFSIYRSLHAAPSQDLLVVIDSRRAELFCRFFPAYGRAQEPCLMTRKEIDALLAKRPGTAMAGDLATPSDDVLCACARLAAEADPRSPDVLPRPLYLRAPDVTLSKRT